MSFQLLSLALLAQLVAAAPMVHTMDNSWQYGTGGGILGFIIFIIDVIAIVEVVKSNRTVGAKLLWSLLIFIFPIVGILIYFLFSDREGHKQGYEAIP